MIILFVIIFGGIIVGLILAPIIAIVVVASQKECPHCKKRISKKANICSYCQKKQNKTK